MPFRPKSKNLTREEQSAIRLENFRKEIITDCHMIPLEDLCERLGTDPDTGLSPEQAKEILEKTGPNVLTPSQKGSEVVKFIKILFHGFSPLLWSGALLSFLSVIINHSQGKDDRDHLVLGLVVIGVVIFSGSFMYYEQRRTQSIMESFANMVPPKATVIRGGAVTIIDSKDVVIGDLVEIIFGDRVPADVRIIESNNLKVDHSPITGETEPVMRGTAYSDEDIIETRNVSFFSAHVVEGTGRGIVIACGDHTVMGHIAGLTVRLKPNKSPMRKELDMFTRTLNLWAVFLGVVLAVACFFVGLSWIQTLLFTISMIMSNAPEGLTATVMICLTLTAKRMAWKNCLVKKMDSVETLGCTSVICSDKTGTLTQNRMTVCHLWYNEKVVEVDHKKSPETTSDEAFRSLIRCATLCNRAEFVEDQEDKPILQRLVRGDASESAILKYIEYVHLLEKDFRKKKRKLIEIPFSSSTKYQISVHALESDTCLVVMKGAPEVVLEHCSEILQEDETKPITEEILAACNEACLHFAEEGERVLGFCDLELNDTYTPKFAFTTEPANFPQRGLRFLGFIAMIDPPRPQVPDAIRKCKAAGIRVTMVTGDHPITAKAMASKVGIITEKIVHEFMGVNHLRRLSSASTPQVRRTSSMAMKGPAILIHGSVLRELQEDELDNILFYHDEVVFARTSPQQKLQIVEGYQRLGEIVAVTGDDVNDAPALRQANTGIALGIVGTEVAQEAADILLLDDNFASIIYGIEEGRRIFDNLKKSITYTLVSNTPEIFSSLLYPFLGIPSPLGLIPVLCIDLLTDMTPGISLAYEKAESDTMLRPPRNPLRDRLVNRKLYFLAYGNLGMLESLGMFFVYFVVMAEHGFFPRELIGIRERWESPVNISDHYGRVWTFDQRDILQNTASTASMMSIVVTQWMNLLACKTRSNSIFKQGMGNMVLNVSLVIATVFVCLLSYLPHMYVFSFYPLSWRWWLYAMPWAVILFLFDECRKSHIRKYPKGWYQRETHF